MRFNSTVQQGVTYRIGSRVKTFNGLSGILLKRFKPSRNDSIKVVIHDECTDTDVTCPEHYIIKVLEW